jgi:hypothetical protein
LPENSYKAAGVPDRNQQPRRRRDKEEMAVKLFM